VWSWCLEDLYDLMICLYVRLNLATEAMCIWHTIRSDCNPPVLYPLMILNLMQDGMGNVQHHYEFSNTRRAQLIVFCFCAISPSMTSHVLFYDPQASRPLSRSNRPPPPPLDLGVLPPPPPPLPLLFPFFLFFPTSFSGTPTSCSSAPPSLS